MSQTPNTLSDRARAAAAEEREEEARRWQAANDESLRHQRGELEKMMAKLGVPSENIMYEVHKDSYVLATADGIQLCWLARDELGKGPAGDCFLVASPCVACNKKRVAGPIHSLADLGRAFDKEPMHVCTAKKAPDKTDRTPLSPLQEGLRFIERATHLPADDNELNACALIGIGYVLVSLAKDRGVT